MYIIAGLGNPGKKYEKTRHNIGFMTLDRLAEKYGIKILKPKYKSLIGEGYIGGEKVILIKPQTYMNNSGEAVREVMHYYKTDISNLIVIYDDIDIALGTIRIRKFGSSGTHNGMKSIIYNLVDDKFPRIRIGIGTPSHDNLVGHVIGSFTDDEVKLVKDSIDTCVCALESFIKDGVDIAMNKYNKRASRVTRNIEELNSDK